MTKWVEWNDPHWTDKPPYWNTVRRSLPEDVVSGYRRWNPIYEELPDQTVLEDFMTVHWAWFKEYQEDVW